uniref:AlNc14C260G9793 protein n=1 Tax=Albugo laibachii Nc14 TaxID=890382 RepID=F0WTX0_9STRA|nr:AlNc14C260G9793 [Albugo laibachii Nc14]CCA26312.1 AlNc14C365G11050 [Albugo laibachii Nc14]|eukprot:CCA26312.1 AlNc14C365G11050 [Albugo laibachii Nc14]
MPELMLIAACILSYIRLDRINTSLFHLKLCSIPNISLDNYSRAMFSSTSLSSLCIITRAKKKTPFDSLPATLCLLSASSQFCITTLDSFGSMNVSRCTLLPQGCSRSVKHIVSDSNQEQSEFGIANKPVFLMLVGTFGGLSVNPREPVIRISRKIHQLLLFLIMLSNIIQASIIG